MITRRHLLATTAASLFFAGFPLRGFAQKRELGKIAVIILEGGMDGLAAVPPIGDPSLFKRRKDLVASKAIKLDPFFGLHPNFVAFAQMLANNEAAIVHATSIPYTLRSHFEGQNLMQTGITKPFGLQTGWLGRAMDVAGIPGKSLSLDMPLLIRGAGDLDNLYPASIVGSTGPKKELMALLDAAYGDDAGTAFGKLEQRTGADEDRRREPAALALHAGQEMAKPGGPNVSVIRVTEFDTHAQQGADEGRQPERYSIVDQIFHNYKKGLGAAWKDTIILTLTEFGRTVQENGSAGTDHGYGTCALIAGGLLKKASVIANWPGLGDKEMFEGRDLASTLDYRAICAAAIEAAFGLAHDEIAERVFMEPKLPHAYGLLFDA
ncbi:MAG TPA: DUF1501 domain-containing protein [Bauldia sp.]|nr:DUF1501 domain-containing protein [Bauldia sp.]